MFWSITEQLKKFEYIFFFNANSLFIEKIASEEFLPNNTQELVA